MRKYILKNISSVYSNAYKNSPVLVLGTFDIVFRIVGRSRAYAVTSLETKKRLDKDNINTRKIHPPLQMKYIPAVNYLL